ncbi:protein PLANT CADMIUM RESISTANCE 7-like [Cryptomeria japonica]|uniref:protein PLANT CADMIUM RESISTANCE 7-like n=1 Tax=Cryptomeria japonica TaxID=3369 RepID=UPI0027DA84A9|nr:protein PLANT CADMIUM RESISTANCE 7-like [Cryptomeria japonica]
MGDQVWQARVQPDSLARLFDVACHVAPKWPFAQQKHYANEGVPGYASAPPKKAPCPWYLSGSSTWSTGLCDCTHDCRTCCLTCFCPCITFGRVAEVVDHGRTSLLLAVGVGRLYSSQYRRKLRAQYDLPKEPCGDCCVHLCCTSCAVSLEHRELKERGLNPSAGWINLPMTPPTAYQGM